MLPSACFQTNDLLISPAMGREFALRAVAGAAMLCVCSGALAAPLDNPLRFFEGRTESVGIMKMIMKKPFRVRSVGLGKIAADGTLHLVQKVHDEGEPPKERVWRIRQVGPGKFAGSMNEAKGPVVIEQVGDGYRFRFKVKGNLSVEQWLIPNGDGKSGTSKVTIRKYGMKVASSDGTVRKLSR